MTAALVTGGVVVGHSPDFGRRLWYVDTDRRASWIGEEPAPHRLPNPVPGDASIIAFDAWTRDPVVVLANGDVFRCHASTPRQRWVPQRSLLGPGQTFVLAGIERRSHFWTLWVLSSERRLAVSNENLVPPVAVGAPIPGDARVLSVRLVGPGAEALCSDGSLVSWMPRGWMRIGHLAASDLVAGGVERKSDSARRWWAVTADREVLVADRELDAAISFGRIAGTAPVLTLRLWNKQVEALLANEERVSTFATARATPVNDPDGAA